MSEQIQIVVSAQDQASQVLSNIDKVGLQGIASSATAAGLALSAFAAGGALAIRSAANEFIAFETGLNNVNTLLSEGSKPIAEFKNELLDLSTKMPDSLENLTNGLYDIISASVDSADAMGVLELASKAATGGLSDTKTAADLGTSVINAYGKEIGELESVYDKIFVAVKRGKTTFPELAQSMGRILPMATATNTSFEEVTSAISTLTRAGIQTPIAATSIAAALGSMLEPTQQAMKSNGIAIKDAQGNFLGLGAVIKQISEKNLGADVIAKIFPEKTAMSGVLALLKQYPGFVEDMNAANASAGASAEAFDKIMNGLGPTLKILSNSFKALRIIFVEDLVPAIRIIAQGLTSFVNVLKSLPPSVRQVITVGGTLSVIFAGISGALLLMAGRIPQVLSVFSGLTKMFSLIPILIKTAMASFLPFSGILLALIPAITGVYLAFKNWDLIKSFFSGVADSARKMVSQLREGFMDWLNDIKPISLELSSIFSTAFSQLGDIAGNAMQVLKTIVSGEWWRLSADLRALWQSLQSFFSTTWTNIKAIFSDPELFSALLTVIQQAIPKIRDFLLTNLPAVFKSTMEAIRKIIISSGQTILNGFEMIMKNLPAIIRQGGGIIVEAFKALWAVVTGIKLEDSGMSAGLNELFQRAKNIIIENMPAIKSAVKDVFIQAFGPEAWQQVVIFKDTIIGTLTGIRDYFAGDGTGFAIFKETVETTFNDVKKFFTESQWIQVFKDTLLGTFGDIYEFFEDGSALETLEGMWKDTFDNLGLIINTFIGLITGAALYKALTAMGIAFTTAGTTVTTSFSMAAFGPALVALKAIAVGGAIAAAAYTGWKIGESVNEITIGSKKIKDHVTDMFTSLMDGGEVASLAIQVTMDDIVEASKVQLPAPDLNAVTAGLNTFGAQSQESIGKTTAALQTGLNTIAGAAGKGIDIGDPFGKLPASASLAMAETQTAVSTGLDGIAAKASEAGLKLQEALKISPDIINMVEPVSTALDALIQSITGYSATISTAFTNMFATSQGTVIAGISTIVTSITENLTQIPPLFDTAFLGVAEKITLAMENIRLTFQTGMGGIFAGLNETLAANILSISEILITGITTVVEQMTELLSTFPEIFAETFEGIAEVTTTAIDSMRDSVTGLSNVITESVPAIKTAVDSINSELSKIGEIKIDASAGAAIVQMIQGVLTQAVSIVEQFAPQFQQYGQSIMNAFATGMEAASQRIIQAAIAAVQQAQRILKSASPPKEGPLKEIDTWGYNLMATYAEGMAGAAPRIKQMLQQAIPAAGDLIAPVLMPEVSGFSPAFATAGMGTTTGGDTYIEEYNISLPGLVVRSEDDVARIKAIVAEAINETRRRVAL